MNEVLHVRLPRQGPAEDVDLEFTPTTAKRCIRALGISQKIAVAAQSYVLRLRKSAHLQVLGALGDKLSAIRAASLDSSAIGSSAPPRPSLPAYAIKSAILVQVCDRCISYLLGRTVAHLPDTYDEVVAACAAS